MWRLSALLALGALSAGSDLALERKAAETVDAGRMTARVRELCELGPRMGGTSSGARATRYLRAAFEELGLEVVELRAEPRLVHEEGAWSVRAWSEPGDDGFELSGAWPYGFSRASEGRATLSLDPAADGAWITDRVPRGRAGVDAARGSPLVLVDGDPTPDGRYARVHHLPATEAGHAPWFGISSSDGARLRAWLDAGRAVELEWSLEARIERAASVTVVARLSARGDERPGASLAVPHFLVCAHGDSDAGGPGANDNASGAAIVLEMARAWSRAVRRSAFPAPRHEVRFAIWGTEIHSTRDYLRRPASERGELLGVLNYDQSGFGAGADQLFVEPDDVKGNVAFVRTVLGVLRDHAPGQAVPAAEQPFPARWATNKSLGGTDSYVFSESRDFRRDGLPSVTLFASAWDRPDEHPATPGMPGEAWRDGHSVRIDHDPWYHSSGDLPENTTDTEPWNMAWGARVGWLAVARWLEALER